MVEQSNAWKIFVNEFNILIGGHPLSTYAKYSEKLTFVTPWYAHVRVLIRGLQMLVFPNILPTYLTDDPLVNFKV